MKTIRAVILYLLIAAFMFTFISFNPEVLHADVTIPETIRIGLSYGQSQANLFTLESETGMNILVFENGKYKSLLEVKNPNGVKIRRDEYYNVVNGKEIEINYVRAAKYEGEVIGPYHIQIGGVYENSEAALKVLKQVSSITQPVFLAYEGGWMVWSQLYLDESECLEQIKIMKKEESGISYSVVHPNKKRIQVIDGATGQLMLLLNSEEKIKIVPKEAKGKVSSLQYKGKKYRGCITMQSLDGSDITLINELPFEHYLYSVVPSEMPASWHIEALKAQAVAARNFALVNTGRHNSYGFDLCSTGHCQAYNGLSDENSAATEAVNATKGKVITYNGALISAFYHSSSGGHTEDSENVWNEKMDYIRGVDDKFSLGSPYDNWTVELNRNEIKEKLVQSNINLGEIRDIRILESSRYGRVTKLEIKGSKETKVFNKEEIRGIIGTRLLKSIWYTLKTDADVFVRGSQFNSTEMGRASNMHVLSSSGKTIVKGIGNKITVKGMNSTKSYNVVPDKYTFDGKGFGHGLGMSQYGAKRMAEAGYNYQKILEHYYQNAKVK